MILEMFNDWSAPITAAFTVVLGVFAIAAWRTSSKSLRQARLASGQSDVRSEEALEAQRHATDLQREATEIAALSRYVSALSALARIQVKSPPAYMAPGTGNWQIDLGMDRGYPSYVNDLCHEVDVAGTMWRFHHAGLRGAESVFARADRTLISAQGWRREERFSLLTQDAQYELNALFAEDVSFFAQEWQARELMRAHFESHLSDSLAKFFTDSPCHVHDDPEPVRP